MCTGRRVPEGTGWVLDGFPTTTYQAKLLEKGLTGGNSTGLNLSYTDAQRMIAETTAGDGDGGAGGAAGSGEGKKSILAPDPRPKPPDIEPESGLNVVILFDISDELVLKRTAGRTCKCPNLNQFHIQFQVSVLTRWS